VIRLGADAAVTNVARRCLAKTAEALAAGINALKQARALFA
jgi:hypothetical protein